MPRLNKKIFFTLFISVFAAVTGVGIVVPLLPVYAHHQGATGFFIGLIFGAFAVSRSVFLPFFGRQSDRHGRKPYIVCGLLTYTIVSIAFVLFPSVGQLIIIRFFQGIASAMLLPVVQAYVGDITPEGREGTIMGMFNLAMFLGLSVGPVAGGWLNDRFNMNAAFIGMGLLSAIGFCLSLMLLPPTADESIRNREPGSQAWKPIITDRAIMALFAVRFAYAGCIGVIWGFLPVLASDRFDLSSAMTGMLVTLGVFISGLFHVPMGALADRISRRFMIVTGCIVITGAAVGFMRAETVHHLLWASIVFGIGGGMAMPAHMALVVNSGTRLKAMGSVMGVLTLSHSLGMLTGSLMAGVLMDISGLRDAFLLGAILMITSMAVFIMLYPREP